MIAKIYFRMGPLLIKIAEEEVETMDEVMRRWKYVYVEVFEGEKIVFADDI